MRVQDVRAFAIKDHRNTPKDEGCGPGYGEIVHYKLLMPGLFQQRLSGMTRWRGNNASARP